MFCEYIDTIVAFYCDILFVLIDEVFCKINVTPRNYVFVFSPVDRSHPPYVMLMIWFMIQECSTHCKMYFIIR